MFGDLTEYKLQPIHYGIIIVAFAILAYGANTLLATPTVAIGDNISVYYTGTFTNGTVFDSNVGGTPLNFTVGAKQLISGFDEGVVGMKLHSSKTIVVPDTLGYGPIDPNAIEIVPVSVFGNQTVQAGMTIVRMAQNNQEERGTVLSVNATNVTIDFNNPLAGKTLVFNVTIAAIQK